MKISLRLSLLLLLSHNLVKLFQLKDKDDLLALWQDHREEAFDDFQEEIYTKELLASINEFKDYLGEYENETMMVIIFIMC
jgi:hypothetical protein